MAQYVWIRNGEACLVNAATKNEALRMVLADRMQAIVNLNDDNSDEQELASEAMKQFMEEDELFVISSKLRIDSSFRGKLMPQLEEKFGAQN